MIARFFLFLASLPTRAFAVAWNAQWDIYRQPIAGTAPGSGSAFLIDLASGWFDFLYKNILGFSIIAFIWGATTMQGVATDEGNKENGKKIMIGALIGLVLAILAKVIVQFADSFLDAVNVPACPSGGGPGCL